MLLSLIAGFAYASPQEKAAQDVLVRLLPDHTNNFVFQTIAQENGKDVFEIESAADGKVVLRGSDGVSMCTALNWYLKYYCNCHVSWYGNQLNLPDPLPQVKTKVRHVSWAKHRYFLNYCCFGYSLAWWDWEQWEKLIDWMALNGVNLPLAVTGQEAVWEAVLKKLGMEDGQINKFFAGPPYLPFQWMGCLDSHGGPLPESWISRHEQLQKKILARQRQLGMTPVLQGFTGHVPAEIVKHYPKAKVNDIHWIEWTTYLLDPLDPLFQKIADIFMEEQTKRFGSNHYYAADTFIEMIPPSGETSYLDSLSKAIYNGMSKYDPQAVWVMQGWCFSFRPEFWTQPRIKAFLDAQSNDTMLVLDLNCEQNPVWNKTNAFHGKPWLWCNIQNFGSMVFLGGDTNKIAEGLPALKDGNEKGNLQGLGFVNEGLGYNPVVYDMLFEMAWRDDAVDRDMWFEKYAQHRYGRKNKNTEKAWKLLKDTVYSEWNITRQIISRHSVIKPLSGPPYNNYFIKQAWGELLQAADQFKDVDTYRFDLVNVARQALSNHATTVHWEAARAYKDKDVKRFKETSERFLQLIRDMDQLLATRSEFLLGKELENAKRWGDTDQEKAKMQWNARRILTNWGNELVPNDYARKEWSGMFNGYYLVRWQRYFNQLQNALETGNEFDYDKYKPGLTTWIKQWSSKQDNYPSTPIGNSVQIAQNLWNKYSKEIKKNEITMKSLTTFKPQSCSNALTPAVYANDGIVNDTDSYWSTDVNDDPQAWWQVDFQGTETIGRVVVVGYYGDKRYYGFKLESSLDGKSWDLLDDKSKNRELSTQKGITCTFEPKQCRYLRVTMTANSANTGMHLVEVAAYKE